MNNREETAIKVMMLAILASVFVYVVTQNYVATLGLQVGRLGDSVAEQKAINTSLRVQIIQAASLTHIAQVARDAGFTRPDVLYLK